MRPLNRIVDAVREIGDAFGRAFWFDLNKNPNGQWYARVTEAYAPHPQWDASNPNEEIAALRVLRAAHATAMGWARSERNADRVQTALERSAAVLRTFGPEYGV